MTGTQSLRPAWTPLTIGLMVLGFIVWWPLGLAMLAYIVWGDQLHDVVRDGKSQFSNFGATKYAQSGHRTRRRATGNAAFDDYRSEELDRLRKERRKLDDEVKEFEEYLSNLSMARDREEFTRYMKERDARRRKSKSDIDDAEIIET